MSVGLASTRPPASAPAPDPSAAGGASPGGSRDPDRSRPAAPWVGPATQSLLTLAAALLGVALTVLGLGVFAQHRAQDLAYADLRGRLAEGTAPLQAPIPVGDPVAILHVPRLGWRHVVLEGTTGRVLRGGPGHRPDSVLPGQAGVSVVYGKALTYGAPFQALPSLAPGDRIDVVTGQGPTTFVVDRVRRGGDPLPTPRPEAARLVLVTAEGTPIPSRVVLVDATSTAAQPAGARPAVASPASQAFAADPNALLWVVLLLPLLVLALVATLVLRARWGRAQGYLVGLPLVVAAAWAAADAVGGLLPNLV